MRSAFSETITKGIFDLHGAVVVVNYVALSSKLVWGLGLMNDLLKVTVLCSSSKDNL